MSLTNDQLLDRILVIEDTLNTIQIALNNLASKQQLKSLLSIRQAEIDELQEKVSALESQVEVLQS